MYRTDYSSIKNRAIKLNNKMESIMRSINKQDKIVFFSTLFAGFLTHGYALANKITNHDDMTSLIGCGDGLAFGRWMWKVWADLQIMNTPFLYGVFNLVLMSLCVVMLIRIFSIKKMWISVLIGCIWISFPANTTLFFYNMLIPIYSIGIFLSVLTIYVYVSGKSVKKKYLIGIVCITVSMGCYQAYFAITVVGIVLYLLLKFYRTNMHWKKLLQETFSALLLLVIGLTAYFVTTKIICNYYNVSMATYQGMDSIGNGYFEKLPSMISSAYGTFFTFHSGIQSTFFAKVQDIIFPIMFIVFGLIIICKHIKQNNKLAALFSFLIVVIYPAICNLTYFYGADFVYTLMQYSNAFFHIAVLVFLDEFMENPIEFCKYGKTLTALVGVAATIGFFQNVMLADKEYYSQQRAQTVAFNYLNNVVSRIQSTDGYEQGMQVALVGYCEDQNIKAIDMALDRTNLGGITSAESFINSVIYYDWLRPGTLQNWIGFADPVLSTEQSRSLLNDPRIAQMPNYPTEGSVQVIDGIMVIHFSSSF